MRGGGSNDTGPRHGGQWHPGRGQQGQKHGQDCAAHECWCRSRNWHEHGHTALCRAPQTGRTRQSCRTWGQAWKAATAGPGRSWDDVRVPGHRAAATAANGKGMRSDQRLWRGNTQSIIRAPGFLHSLMPGQPECRSQPCRPPGTRCCGERAAPVGRDAGGAAGWGEPQRELPGREDVQRRWLAAHAAQGLQPPGTGFHQALMCQHPPGPAGPSPAKPPMSSSPREGPKKRPRILLINLSRSIADWSRCYS